jgi:predicted nucleotidyltransferase
MGWRDGTRETRREAVEVLLDWEARIGQLQVNEAGGTGDMVDEKTIDKAAHLLLEAAPGARVILFGSHARRDASPDSDVDFLVVEPTVTSRHQEMVRLRDVLRPFRIPVDVLVVSEETFRYWCETPGTLYYEIAQEGRVLEPVA